MELTLDETLQKAVEAHKAGRSQEADRLYTAILQAQPKHPDANHNMGVLAVGVNKMQEALAYFKTALEANSSIGQYWLSYIDALIQLDQIVDAQTVLEQAKGKGASGEAFEQLEQRLNELNETQVEADPYINGQNQVRPNVLDSLKLDQAIRLAKKKAKEESPEDSKRIYNDILARFPKNKRALDGIKSLSGGFIGKASKVKEPPQDQQQRLINLYQQGQLQQALDSAKQLLSQFPNSLILYNIQGATKAALGQFDAAIDSYKQALKIKPDYAEAYNNMGNALKDKGDLKAAIDSYKQALKINPDYAEAYNNMGNALKDKGDLKAAIDSYKQALKVKPDYADAYYNMGTALNDRGDLKAAIDSYKQALKIKPDYAEAYYNMGSALQEKGDPESAIDSFKKALKIKPDYAEAFNNIGNALRGKGDVEAAIDSFKKALKIKPDYANAHNNMGNALQDKGDLEAAIDSYQQALKIKPDYAKAYNNMGALLQHKGDLKAAIDSYQEALKIKPDYAEAYYNMGNALRDKGDLEAAIESYKQALKIKPDYAGAWYNLIFPLQAMKLQGPTVEELLSTISPQPGSKYAQIAKSVLSFSLNQGGNNAESALNEVCKLLSKADNSIIKNPEVTNKESPPQTIRPNKTVALVHFGRSGTGLLHSLIDGHPEVSTMPSIYFSEFFNHSTWDKIVLGGWSKMADRFIATYEVLFDASVQNPIESKSGMLIANVGQKEGMANVGDQRDEVLRVDKALFREELQRLMDLNDHLDAYVFFKLVHMAYDKALKDRNIKGLIFYHIHNPDNYAKLNFVQAAPNANWVMMVREPIQACESWVRSSFHNNQYTNMLTKVITMLFEIDNIIYDQKNAIGVRLEDLKESPQKTIPALCDWMGIEETESLYEMTAQGKKWWGDPGSPDFKKDGMEPFGKTSIERTLGSIFTENDQFILRTLFYPFSVRFGYAEQNLEQFKVDLQAIRPMLDKMFDFEIKMAQRMHKDAQQFMKSGYYLYLRSGLFDRWNMLAKWHTYPNMIKPLKINQ
jgi:tetratricopeptide (TPR) repeat protein